MKEKMLMPTEEWEDFRSRVLGLTSDLTQVRFFKMAFFGAMACATDFFENVLSGDYTAEEVHNLLTRWRDGLRAELEKYEGELTTALLEDQDGRDN